MTTSEAKDTSGKECVCLSREAHKIEKATCKAAFDYYQASNPTSTSDADKDAQKLIHDHVATALKDVENVIRSRTGPVPCLRGSLDDDGDISQDDQGHVQPWMSTKMHEAVKTGVKKVFIEIDVEVLKKPEANTYTALSQGTHPDTYLKRHLRASDPITNPYLDSQVGSLLCLCKYTWAHQIIEAQVREAFYRLDRGWDPLLNEPNALNEAKERARDHIYKAGQDAKEAITEVGDEQHFCTKSETTHLRMWMQWHVEWSCEQARRQFSEMMWDNPCREDSQRTEEREAAQKEVAEAERLRMIAEHPFDESHHPHIIDMSGPRSMPYPGCKCLLWGATEFANNACNETLKRTLKISDAWEACLIDSIHEANILAMKEIGIIVSREKPDRSELRKGPPKIKDDFPTWQQDIVKRMTAEAARKVEEQYKLHGRDPGAVADEAAKDAERRLRLALLDAKSRKDDESESEWKDRIQDSYDYWC
ncbi:hypothetical protein P7C71_g3117, partial [Lecanoromycetidae sp. Uapishka_2]